MSKFLGAAAAALVAMSAAPAAAVTNVVFSNVTGAFFGGVLTDGNAITNYSGSDTANAKIRWGVSAGEGQSGYDFNSAGTINTSLAVPGASPVVTLGEFKHLNVPIFPPSADFAFLRLTANVNIGGTDVGAKNFVFRIDHDETTNNADPCPYGGANGQGVNVNGCADRIVADFSSTSDRFSIDGIDYTLDVTGFLVDNKLVDGFTTVERQTNSALLVGRVTAFSSAVPEPDTWAMMILGFGMVGAAMRRGRPHSARA